MKYELGIILTSEEAVLSVPKILQEFGFQIERQEESKHISLAYKINKFSEGFFSVFYISTEDTENIVKLNNALELNNDVLRFILIKHEDKKETEAKKESPKKEVVSESKEEETPTETKEEEAPKETLSNEALEKKLEEILQ